MTSSITSSIFYHIYPLGMCGTASKNDFCSPAGSGLRKLVERVPHLASLGINAVYIGPLFESTAHGYDTVDYYHVDRRLGTNEDLRALVDALHNAGVAVILDAVLNHTGRDFFAFRDLREKGTASEFKEWYRGIDFGKRSPCGDGFSYEGWSGNYDLAKLNTENPRVREHLFGAVRFWIETLGIDGLRLDAADVLAPDFMDALSAFAKSLKPDFWLMGEVVHGDYRNWARAGRLDSVTNYELYKGLWSSFNDKNFFEVAWSLNRQSGPDGLYKNMTLYTFLDNHDVNRIASVIKNPAHLIPLYGLLFTVPGVPSIYYGSEWGIRGEKKHGTDADLRPAVRETADQGKHNAFPDAIRPHVDSGSIENAVRTFAKTRKENRALREGSYRQLHVAHEQFAFMREIGHERTLVAINSSAKAETITVSVGAPNSPAATWRDDLDRGFAVPENGGAVRVTIAANGIRILRRENYKDTP